MQSVGQLGRDDGVFVRSKGTFANLYFGIGNQQAVLLYGELDWIAARCESTHIGGTLQVIGSCTFDSKVVKRSRF